MNKILVAIILGFVLYTACSKGKGGGCNPPHKKSDTTIVRDTTWSVHDTTIYKTLTLKGKTLHDTIVTPPQYIADTNYPKLLMQYNDLLKKYMALVEFRDTIRIDTLGYVAIVDTVNQNSLKGRSVRTNYKIPTITNTVTIQHYEKPKAQLFFGGGIDLTKTLEPVGVRGGVILKTKKDQLIGLNIGTGTTGGINYGFNSFWKIKLK
jgi:hypothetical protein